LATTLAGGLGRRLSRRERRDLDEPRFDVLAAPAVERRTYLGLDLLGPGDALPAPVTVVGIDPVAEPQLHDLTLGAGAPLDRPDEPSALVSATLAREDELVLGSELTIGSVAALKEPPTPSMASLMARVDG